MAVRLEPNAVALAPLWVDFLTLLGPVEGLELGDLAAAAVVRRVLLAGVTVGVVIVRACAFSSAMDLSLAMRWEMAFAVTSGDVSLDRYERRMG